MSKNEKYDSDGYDNIIENIRRKYYKTKAHLNNQTIDDYIEIKFDEIFNL